MSEDAHEPLEPLLTIEGPRLVVSGLKRGLFVGAWIAVGMAQFDLLAHTPWPHLSGRLGRYVMLVGWCLVGTALANRWEGRRKARAGSAVVFPDRVHLTKHVGLPGHTVYWASLSGYSRRAGYVRLRRQREQALAALFDDLWELLSSKQGDLAIPTPSEEEAARVAAVLEGAGVYSLD